MTYTIGLWPTTAQEWTKLYLLGIYTHHIHLCGYMTVVGTVTNVQMCLNAQSVPSYTTGVGTMGSKLNRLKKLSAAQSLCEGITDHVLSCDAKGMLGGGGGCWLVGFFCSDYLLCWGEACPYYTLCSCETGWRSHSGEWWVEWC